MKVDKLLDDLYTHYEAMGHGEQDVYFGDLPITGIRSDGEVVQVLCEAPGVDRLIRCVSCSEDGAQYDVLYGNGVRVGLIYREIDNRFVFVSSLNRGGAWSGTLLYAIARAVERLNAEHSHRG